MTDGPTPTSGGPTATSALMAAWSALDQRAQFVIGGSIAALAITVIGLPFGTWDSIDFVLLVLVAATVALVAAELGTRSRNPEPLALLEAGAAVVLAVLAVWNLIEVTFDLAPDDRGGIIGILFTLALAIAGVVVLVGALQRLGGMRALRVTEGRGVTVAAAGLVVVLAGSAASLSIGSWTMAQASLSLAVLTIATAVVLASRRIDSPVPAAWAGVVLGVFGAILAFGQWSDLVTRGREEVELGPVDFLAFLVYAIGVVMIIVGGVMTALEQRPISLAMDDVETVEPADRIKRVE